MNMLTFLSVIIEIVRLMIITIKETTKERINYI